MVPTPGLFHLLEGRCQTLLARYIEPLIAAERAALAAGNPLPPPDYDSMAAFRLLSHAELEGYFEAKASAALDELDKLFRANQIATQAFASITLLYLLKERKQPKWTSNGRDDSASRTAEFRDLKALAQEALGFGRRYVADNNGVKEGSMLVLSALMGAFPSEVDPVLLNELDQYGKKRGDVAHNSWSRDTRTFDSADIEKSRIERILALTKSFYEPSHAATPAAPVATWPARLTLAWRVLCNGQ